MPFAYSKLHGLPADRLLAAIDPILAAHGLEGVELIWKTDNRGWLLYLTVERSAVGVSSDPGAGVTLDDCSELSRDLSAALDVDDMIPGAYRLEVGTPGIERRLYSLADFQRFTTKLAKVKLHKPHAGEYTFRGYVAGVENAVDNTAHEGGAVSASFVLLGKEPDTAADELWRFEFDNINSASLVLEWGGDSRPKTPTKAPKGAKGAKKSGAQPASKSVDAAASGSEHDYSEESSSEQFGEDTEFDSAAAVATTQVKHGS